jgi:hypothetical protein
VSLFLFKEFGGVYLLDQAIGIGSGRGIDIYVEQKVINFKKKIILIKMSFLCDSYNAFLFKLFL